MNKRKEEDSKVGQKKIKEFDKWYEKDQYRAHDSISAWKVCVDKSG